MQTTLKDLKNLAPKDFVCLTDEVTIKDLMERGVPNATNGLELQIEKIIRIREKTGICEWRLCPLVGGPDGYIKLYLLVKSVDAEYDVRVYWVPDDFANPRTKGELVNDGVLHIFEKPENPNDFLPFDLEYTDWIDLETENGRIEYDHKVDTMFGEAWETPAPSGIRQPLFAAVTEYQTANEKAEDPEILIVEIGGLDEDGEKIPEGGLVRYFHGGPIGDNDINFIRR